jgi:hypothetical protein
MSKCSDLTDFHTDLLPVSLIGHAQSEANRQGSSLMQDNRLPVPQSTKQRGKGWRIALEGQRKIIQHITSLNMTGLCQHFEIHNEEFFPSPNQSHSCPGSR